MIAAPQRITEFRLPRGRLVFALLLVLIALATALVTLERRHPSAPSSVTTKPAATVTGSVVFEGGLAVEPQSGIHPVLRYARLVIVGVTTAGARITRHARADVAGHFSLNLPPGRYTVTALAFGPATRPLSTQPHTRVTVTPGHPVAIRITGHVH
jgi:hypothetical protein